MAMVHTLPKGRQIWSCKYLYLCRGTCFTKGKSHLSNTPAATGHWELWSYALLWLCSKHHGPFHGSHPHHQPRQALPAQDRPANAARMHAPCPPLPGQIQTQAQLLLMQIRRWLSSIRRAAATMASNAWPAHGLSFWSRCPPIGCRHGDSCHQTGRRGCTLSRRGLQGVPRLGFHSLQGVPLLSPMGACPSTHLHHLCTCSACACIMHPAWKQRVPFLSVLTHGLRLTRLQCCAACTCLTAGHLSDEWCVLLWMPHLTAQWAGLRCQSRDWSGLRCQTCDWSGLRCQTCDWSGLRCQTRDWSGLSCCSGCCAWLQWAKLLQWLPPDWPQLVKAGMEGVWHCHQCHGDKAPRVPDAKWVSLLVCLMLVLDAWCLMPSECRS